jgi:LysM repeat protein
LETDSLTNTMFGVHFHPDFIPKAKGSGLKKTAQVAAFIAMKYQKFLSSRFITANVILATCLGCLKSEAATGNEPAPAELTEPRNQLFELIDSAKYSKEDKAALKAGLGAAIPTVSTNEHIVKHVSQETIDIQIKKLPRDYTGSLAFASSVLQCIKEKSSEFTKSETFQRLSIADRDLVSAYFEEIAEHYHARVVETLLAFHGRPVSIPPNVSASITNAEYRNLLHLAAKNPPAHNSVRLNPGQKSYVLKHGDSLASVARKHNISPEAIVAANPGLVPTRMRPGQVLVIPSIGVTASAPVLKKETVLSSALGKVYR